jgi:hypothetical protein
MDTHDPAGKGKLPVLVVFELKNRYVGQEEHSDCKIGGMGQAARPGNGAKTRFERPVGDRAFSFGLSPQNHCIKIPFFPLFLRLKLNACGR